MDTQALRNLPQAIPTLPIVFLRRPHRLPTVGQDPIGCEPHETQALSSRRSRPALGPVPGMADCLGPNGIEHHIATEFEQMGLRFHQNRRESALQEMPYPLMPAIDGLGIGAVELPHASRERRPWGFEQQMIVVVHRAIGMAVPAETIDDVGQLLEEQRAVPIINHNILPGIATTRDMVDRAGIFQTQRTSHGGALPELLSD